MRLNRGQSRREEYRDSPAVFEHIGNLGPLLDELLATAAMKLEVLGTPSDGLAEALGGFGARIYAPLA